MTLMSTLVPDLCPPTLRSLDLLRSGSLGNSYLTMRRCIVYSLVANLTLHMRKWPSLNHGEPVSDKYVFVSATCMASLANNTYPPS